MGVGLMTIGLSMILTLFAGVICNALGNLLTTELEDWMPYIIAYLIQRAGKRLPEGEARDQFVVQLAGDVATMPGLLGKIWFAYDAARGASKMARESSSDQLLWVERCRDFLAWHGARIVPRSLFKILKNDLHTRLPPEQADAVLRAVRTRFEPKLRVMLKTRITRFGNYRQTASEIEIAFARNLTEFLADVRENGLDAVLGNKILDENEKKD